MHHPLRKSADDLAGIPELHAPGSVTVEQSLQIDLLPDLQL
jgi:hypothetical protein